MEKVWFFICIAPGNAKNFPFAVVNPAVDGILPALSVLITFKSNYSESLQQKYKMPAIKAIAKIRNNIFTHFGTSRSAPSLFA